MKKSDLPIPIHEIAFLQAYLYKMFSLEGRCKQNFERTEWHLKETHKEEEVKSIIDFFRSNGLKCDCDIIRKFNLKSIEEGIVKFHD